MIILKDLIPGQARLPGMTQYIACWSLFRGRVVIPKRRYGKHRYLVLAVAEPPCFTIPPFHPL